MDSKNYKKRFENFLILFSWNFETGGRPLCLGYELGIIKNGFKKILLNGVKVRHILVFCPKRGNYLTFDSHFSAAS